MKSLTKKARKVIDEGLQEFMGQDDSGKVFFSDEDKSDFITGQAVGICLAFIRDLYDNGILEGEPPESIGKIEEGLKGIGS